MAADTRTLNAKNLAALGAERLAELLLGLAGNDAAAKRMLRLELASKAGGGTAAAEIRKRLATIAKARSHIDWNKARAFTRDIEDQHTAVMRYVAPAQPAEAVDLLWRFLEMAPSLYERCDDSNGVIGDMMRQALADMGALVTSAKLPVATLVERVFASVRANDYGQFDGLIAGVAEALGREGLVSLKAKFEALAKTPPAKTGREPRGYIIRADGLHEIDLSMGRHARLIQSSLTDIADALGDVDGYAAQFTAEERASPAVAAKIAERLLAAGRAEEAMAALEPVRLSPKAGTVQSNWEQAWVASLEALGRAEEAQQARWTIFERGFSAGYLRDYLKRLPDFDDEEAELRAIAHVRKSADFHQALGFLVKWPAHDAAAAHVLERHGELDGDLYWLLTPAAEALEPRHPLAATLILRAMVGFTLDTARSKRYGHAMRHLKSCEHMAKRIEDWQGHPDHDSWAAELKRRHGRKAAFWQA